MTVIMIKAILFDFDDTLVQTKVIRFEAVKHTAKKFYNLSLTDEHISKHWGKPFAEMMLEIFNHVDTSENIIERYKSILPEYPNKPYPETLDTINALKVGYKLGIVSSSSTELIISGLKNVGIDPSQFDYIQGAEKSEFHKPDGRVFEPSLLFLQQLNISRDQVVYVGDSIDDFAAAKSADIHFIGVHGRTISKEDFDKVEARSISSLKEIVDAINEL